MTTSATILQIVPHVPGSLDGVGDYALQLAQVLKRDHGIESVFLIAEQTSISDVSGFPAMSGFSFEKTESSLQKPLRGVILHYVNYGYQARGVPFHLRNFAQRLRRISQARWITMFHELYASGTPWESAFWLRPFQVRIARDLIDLSDVCFVSNDVIKSEILRRHPAKPLQLVPVMSNLGEPALVDFASDSHKWAICGGASVILKSLRSFVEKFQKIPKALFPSALEVIGGREHREVHHEMQRIARLMPALKCNYYPEVTSERASALLSQCSFGWIDYFGKDKPWPGMILKSGSFAAFCAHGIIPISTYPEPPPSVAGDSFPGLYYVTSRENSLPSSDQISNIRRKIHSWYHEHASSDQTGKVYAEALS